MSTSLFKEFNSTFVYINHIGLSLLENIEELVMAETVAAANGSGESDDLTKKIIRQVEVQLLTKCIRHGHY